MFAHEAEELTAMVAWLCSQAAAAQMVAVAIETPHGPVVEALMDRTVPVVSVNSKQLDRFRDRFSPAGAKDDRRDALCLLRRSERIAGALCREWEGSSSPRCSRRLITPSELGITTP